jgi:DNA adenine methylase
LAVHQMSYSGLGTMAGGPLGGKNQTSKDKIDSRWSPSRLTRRIDELHALFSRFEIKSEGCTSYDFERVLYGSEPALVYLDPPYFLKGAVCYEYGFSTDDHWRLATVLRSTNHHWVLSYDDCPEIRQLYSWARIQELPVTYSIGGGGTQKTELLITKK